MSSLCTVTELVDFWMQGVWALAFGHFSQGADEDRQIKCEYRLLNKKKKGSYTWVNVQSVDMSGCPGVGR